MYTHSDQRSKQNFWKYKGAQFRWGMKLILNEIKYPTVASCTYVLFLAREYKKTYRCLAGCLTVGNLIIQLNKCLQFNYKY